MTLYTVPRLPACYVSLAVFLQTSQLGKSRVTKFALVRLLSAVYPEMSLEVRLLGEGCITLITLVGFLTCVCPGVLLQAGLL